MPTNHPRFSFMLIGSIIRLAPYLQAAGLEKEYLLDLSQSRYKPSESMYMIIPESAPRLQALIRFLEYLFPLY